MLFKQTINEKFVQYKAILMLLSIYILSASNSAESKHNFSAENHLQTNERNRLMIEISDILLNVRLILTDDIHRQIVVDRFEINAFVNLIFLVI